MPPVVPYSHTIHPIKRIIILRFDGILSLVAVCEGVEKLWADPLYDPTFDGITDLSRAVVNANVEDVRELSRFIGNTRNRALWRIRASGADCHSDSYDSKAVGHKKHEKTQKGILS